MRWTILPLVPLLLAGCGSGQEAATAGAPAGAAATAAAPVTNEILWVDDITFAKYKLSNFGVTPEQLNSPPCNTEGWGIEFVSVFDEAGAAVASPAKAIADPNPVANDEGSFTCRFRARIRVDDANRYRAERSAGNFETFSDYPDTVEYAFVDKATLASQDWTWQSRGGFTKR